MFSSTELLHCTAPPFSLSAHTVPDSPSTSRRTFAWSHARVCIYMLNTDSSFSIVHYLTTHDTVSMNDVETMLTINIGGCPWTLEHWRRTSDTTMELDFRPPACGAPSLALRMKRTGSGRSLVTHNNQTFDVARDSGSIVTTTEVSLRMRKRNGGRWLTCVSNECEVSVHEALHGIDDAGAERTHKFSVSEVDPREPLGRLPAVDLVLYGDARDN